MARFNIYLNFPGNTEEAFNFYKSVLGGEFTGIMRYKDMPGVENLSKESQDKVMHIGLSLTNGNVLMGTDVVEGFGEPYKPGNYFSIAVNGESKEEAEILFSKLSDGGTVVQPLADSAWNSYFGMFTDKFGIQWMIDVPHNK